MADHENSKPRLPLRRLLDLVGQDRSDLMVLVAYTLLVGGLSLTVPLAAQALVNTIVAGMFLQPLVVLTGLLFAGLLTLGFLRLLQLRLVELLQQRIFARVALRLSEHVPRVRGSAVQSQYMPELANRFFDVVTVQKVWAKILLDGPATLFTIALGLALLGVYSPYLLVFDLVLLGCVVIVVGVMGIGGPSTSIIESKEKYRVAHWIEELGRCQNVFKFFGHEEFGRSKVDAAVYRYLTARRTHFRVIFRQALGNYFIHALASSGVLAIGGWLVIERKLTMGQLVAAELVVVSVLASLEKLITMTEDVYDILAGADKIGSVIDLPCEPREGQTLPFTSTGVRLECHEVSLVYPDGSEVLEELDLTLEAGSHVALVGRSGSGKSTLTSLLTGLFEPSRGTMLIDGLEVRELISETVHRSVALVTSRSELFDGTIEENLLVGRDWINHEEVRAVIGQLGLDRDLKDRPQGLRTHVLSEGRNLSTGQISRIQVARALLGKPRLLILDEAFNGLSQPVVRRILKNLFKIKGMTLVVVSHDPFVLELFDRLICLDEGKIRFDGSPIRLAKADPELLVELGLTANSPAGSIGGGE